MNLWIQWTGFAYGNRLILKDDKYVIPDKSIDELYTDEFFYYWMDESTIKKAERWANTAKPNLRVEVKDWKIKSINSAADWWLRYWQWQEKWKEEETEMYKVSRFFIGKPVNKDLLDLLRVKMKIAYEVEFKKPKHDRFSK